MRKVTEDFIGTCQACFGEFKVNEKTQQIVLHGYQRPGDGYIVGNCFGAYGAPFEYDHQITDSVISSHRAFVAQRQDRLTKLQAGEITELSYSERVYDRKYQCYNKVSKTVSKGEPEFAYRLRIEIANVEGDIRFYTRVADHLQIKVDAWTRQPIIGIDVPATGLSRTLRKAYDPDEADVAVARAAEKAARDAKPGKLKVLFYYPAPERMKCDGAAWREQHDRIEAYEKTRLAEIKQWVKETFTTGRVIVRESYAYDLPSAISKQGRFNVIAAHVDWSYRDDIAEMVDGAERFENDKKKISYTARRAA